MEARLGSESHQFFVAGTSNLNGKKSFDWDLNDWRWDSDRFVASPCNVVPIVSGNKQLCHDAEKRRRVMVLEEDGPLVGVGPVSLELRGHVYPFEEADLSNEGNNGKKSKLQAGNSTGPTCQVEGCDADLSDSKDYHRRHKVCEMHAKATSAVVKNAIQRFCQQCSRFHLLEEFDEGKRSCRRRLAGHNKRRRKTHPAINVNNGNSSIDERACGNLLISLLRILSNLQSTSSDRLQDEDLVAHFLGNLASLANSFDPSILSRLLQASQNPQKLVNTVGTSSDAVVSSLPIGVHEKEFASPLCSRAITTSIADTQGYLRPTDHVTYVAATTIDMPSNGRIAPSEHVMDRVIMDFDLNHTYNDTQNCEEGSDKLATPLCTGNDSPNGPSWLLQSSPPQTSGNSDSTSNQSQYTSHEVAQCRTDRMIFKLFDKDPNDLPLDLRAQILGWLSSSPTDIESYIRPGCIILTVYIRQAESAWIELCHHLNSSLSRLLHDSTYGFWTRGWIFARVRNNAAFIYDGQVVLDMPLLIGDSNRSKILSVTPIAVPHSTMVKFVVKGANLAQPTSRLLCSFDGKYLTHEATQALDGTDGGAEHDSSQCLSFSCLLPDVMGRGFIEFEDSGLHNDFFPFIVADEDVCSEIRLLENAINISSNNSLLQEITDVNNARNEALDFINELGWLLRKSHNRSVSGEPEISQNIFHLTRFGWLMSFAMSRDWSAVVKRLLDILFNGTIDAGGQSPTQIAMSANLLLSAVQINSRSMVELLLRYVPSSSLKEAARDQFLFKPDTLGPSGLSPLHVAASTADTLSVLDALTDDPGQLGIKAWKNLRDSTGFTPEDYAIARGHNSYITLVQKKIDKQQCPGQVVLNVSGEASYKIVGAPKSAIPNGFELSKSWFSTQQPYCNRCSQQLVYPNPVARTMFYRPLMLSLVGIAAVCVCVGLLFKTPPRVFYVFPSFRWELLEYGFI